MLRHGNQTLINNMQMKSEPIASDSPRFILKLIEDQGCKYYDKQFRLFAKRLSFSWSKTNFLSFVIRELLTFECVVSNRSSHGPLIKKFCMVRIGLNVGEKSKQSVVMCYAVWFSALP